jgi:hypothetical protein
VNGSFGARFAAAMQLPSIEIDLTLTAVHGHLLVHGLLARPVPVLSGFQVDHLTRFIVRVVRLVSITRLGPTVALRASVWLVSDTGLALVALIALLA